MVYGSEGSLTGCFTGGTDNQSNTFATRKLLSTKFPLTILIMELSEQLRTRNSALSLRWEPREQNQAADDLTNLDLSKFDEKHGIPLEPAKFNFLVLGELNQAAGALYEDLLKEKENKLSPGSIHESATPKRKVTERLKWKDPWQPAIICSKLFSRLATQGATDCKPPIKIPYTFQELVQNSCTRFMANVFCWKLED